MRKRLICPNPEHKEKTPSYVIYEDYGHCFGCGYRGKVAEGAASPPVPKEDINATLSYIATLPTKTVRGLDLPCDDQYFYILFPGYSYYKKRLLVSDGSVSKYKCPSGHAKPLYIPYHRPNHTSLAIVEGELNALSLAQIEPSYNICSPGGTADFYGKNYEKYCQYYLQGYKSYTIIVDRDGAGCKAAIELKTKLMKHSPDIKIILQDRDCNEWWQEDPEGLKMEMCTRL